MFMLHKSFPSLTSVVVVEYVLPHHGRSTADPETSVARLPARPSARLSRNSAVANPARTAITTAAAQRVAHSPRLDSSLSLSRHSNSIMVLGRLAHYAIDALLLSTVVAGVKRSTGFTCVSSIYASAVPNVQQPSFSFSASTRSPSSPTLLFDP